MLYVIDKNSLSEIKTIHISAELPDMWCEACECFGCVRFLHNILHKMFYFYRNLLIASVAFVFLATAVVAAPVEGMMVYNIFHS